MANEFAARTSVEQVEEGADLAPKFDADGLIPAVTTDAATGELLMVGYMNAEALRRTIETGEAHYWSRSRQVLWHKGATSGLVQKVTELMIDDDQDCVWLKVQVAGGASCHVGYRTCFYRRIPIGKGRTRVHRARQGLRPEGHLRRRAESDQALTRGELRLVRGM
jgi:phosphoribosyl-AMP cyclohydrolase